MQHPETPADCLQNLLLNLIICDLLQLCVVSIGVAYKEQVVVGLVYNPVLDDMYTAIRGRGAFCNGKRINVTEGEISEAVINCGCEFNKNV